MSQSTNKALVKSFVEEVFNNHDISAAEKYFAKENPHAGRVILTNSDILGW